LKKLATLAIAFVLLTGASDYLRPANPVFINGKLFGTAALVNGTWAIPVEDIQKNVEGRFAVSGNFLRIARDPQSGLPTGKRMHKPFVITKELDKASPIIVSSGKQFIALSDVARLFGGTLAVQSKLPAGTPINLSFPRLPNAAINWGD